jgi:hypothetical protein
MGRKPLHPDRAGVTVVLPRTLLDEIDAVTALWNFGDRSHVIARLLWRGIADPRTQIEFLDFATREALRPPRRRRS